MPKKPKTFPMEIDAEATLQMILTLLRERLVFGKPAKSNVMDAFENGIRQYGRLCVKEASRQERRGHAKKT